jgi:HK97 family phage prohead protease
MPVKALEFAAPLELKFSDAVGELSGYASTFGNRDLQGDVVAPGAFAETLAAHRADGTMPAMLWAHDSAEPVGTWTELAVDAKGLAVTGRFTMGARRGAEARALAKDGALALSIGYRTVDARFVDGARLLTAVDLMEISLVAMPANPMARITAVKNAAGAADEIRDAVGFERFLKKSGFSNVLARRLAAGWNDAVGRPGDDEAMAAITAALKESARRFKS